MDKPSTIRLLAATNNTRGDLFTRLMSDLFFALGYDDLRFDVHKSGRELDILGRHRLEPRRLVAECKAHAEKMGGDALNKFFGAVTRERGSRTQQTPVAGYFVSLSGFTETGIEQELNTSVDDRVILLDASQVIEELVRRRVLVSATEAAERAGRCAAHMRLGDAVVDGAELLGHERGYIWAVFYAQGKERTHFALIHADGTPLAEAVAQDVVQVDRKCRGKLHSLRYLAPPAPTADRAALRAAAVQRYRQWIGEECGYIQLDGLPADTDLSATRLRLERLFVPLKVVRRKRETDDAGASLERPGRSSSTGRRRSKEAIGPELVGTVLTGADRLALLAKPGGGKSTLLKRLAIAYALPERRVEIDDGLPERDWLPLFLRCRELRDRAHRPLLDLLDDLPRSAGMNADEASLFGEHMHDALRNGRALLLVDGLDELSVEGARREFAAHLRTFLAMFPGTALVVTSREAGFRLVAGVIASVCERLELAPFDKSDVSRLCEGWNVVVINDSERVRREAHELATTIWANERIRALAE